MELSKRDNFAEAAVGVTPPRSFILDASVLEYQEEHKIISDDIKANRIEFVFPNGFNQIDLLEECRALNRLDDFDTMYDVTMQMLEGRPVTINVKYPDGSRSELCSFQVTGRYQNLRGVDAINEYPVLVTWLAEFVGASLAKKYPLLGQLQPQPQAAAETDSTKTRRS